MLRKAIKYPIILLLCFFIVGKVLARENLNVKMTLEKSDWIYNLGESAQFQLLISGNISDYYTVFYEIGPEKMTPTKIGTFQDNKSFITIDGGTMITPGFLRCNVVVIINGKQYTTMATAAFEPGRIKPTIKNPTDFDKFWKKEIETARKIPLDTQFRIIERLCTEQYNVFQVKFQNNEFYNYSYGMLTIPKKEGKYPAIIRVPGAGVHQLNPEAEFANKDFITLSLYIHPFPGDWQKEFYDSLRNSSYIDYKFWGVQSKETFFYKRVITGCVKAVDVIFCLKEFDMENLLIWGSSQGGALSIITTALDKRIKALVAFCPAMCDYTGYLYGRAGGWPHYLKEENIEKFNNKQTLKTLPYFDVVNFARKITVPGFYSWGFNDTTTPPTSFYSAYNVIKSSKEVFIVPSVGHSVSSEQRREMYNWIERFMNR